MGILLVDVGNTTCDFRGYDLTTKSFTKLFRPLSKEGIIADSKALKAKLDESGLLFSAILFVSVVPNLNPNIRALGKLYKIPVYSARNNFPIALDRFEMDDITALGADFIVNFYGYIANYPKKNAAIVSLGTATTVSLIQQSKFIGTTISSGLRFSLDALLNNAALLQEMDYQTTHKLFGKNTFDAINVGSINGHYYMIKGIIAQMATAYPIEDVLFTGGNSIYYRDFCQRDDIIIDELLIFKGLVQLYHSFLA